MDKRAREQLYKSQVERVAQFVSVYALPMFAPGRENSEDRIETLRQLMTGELRPPELEIDGDRIGSPADFIDLMIKSAAMDDGDAVPALKQARAWYRSRNEPQMPDALREWQPPAKPPNRPKTTGWRDAVLALIVRKIEAAWKPVPRKERPLSVSRNAATEEHLTICDAVAEGWNKVFNEAFTDAKKNDPECIRPPETIVTYEIVLKARNRDRRKRK